MPSLRPALALAGLLAVAGCHWQLGAPSSRASKPAPARAEAPMPVAQAGAPVETSTSGKSETTDRKKSSRAEKREAKRAAHRARVGDGHVVADFMAYNNADISYARIAAARSRNEDVRNYALRMLTDNASLNQLAMRLVAGTDIELEDNQTTTDLREISAARRVQLRELSGTAFDIAYMESEISYHAELLTRFDEVFLPSARNGELKKLIQSVRPTVAAHLMQAESIGATFGLPASGIRP